MAKKKSSRYSPQAGALRKKEEARKLAERQAKYQQNKKQIWTAVAAAALALVLIIIAVDFFYTPNGSMRMFFGQLMGVKENAIIGQMDDLYYTFGYMNTPEGFEPEEFTLYSNADDRKDQDFYYVANDETNIIRSTYVTSVEGRGAEEMLASLLSYTTYDTMTEAKTTTLAGHEVHYMYATDTSETEETMGQVYSLLAIYVDTVHDSCILVNTTSPYYATLEEIPTEEALLAASEAILANLTLEK